MLEVLPPVLTPPFVDRNFGIPPANIPPKPGAAPVDGGGGGGGGAEDGVSEVPVLYALARAFGTGGGLNPPLGTGGAPPNGAVLLLTTLPTR
jgi:hypothetical protein